MNRCRAIITAFGLLIWLGTLPTFARDLDKDLSQRRSYWEKEAFHCVKGSSDYPSKEHVGEPTRCDDGDMTLFNGLLCASGDQRGCIAVKNSQGPDGRWWRSPGKIGQEAPTTDVSFSADQSLGVFLYVATTGDVSAFDAWINWIDLKRPCAIEVAGRCLLKGWPRFCTDDADKRCTLRPTSCQLIQEVGKAIGSAKGVLCQRILREFGVEANIFPPLSVEVVGSAAVNDAGFPTHLAAVNTLLLQKLGIYEHSTKIAAKVLTERERLNPFFKFLNKETRTDVIRSLLNVCPSPEHPALSRTQWSWERTDSEEAWRHSMLWDCIFVSNLISAE